MATKRSSKQSTKKSASGKKPVQKAVKRAAAAGRRIPTGVTLLRDPTLNKSTAFTEKERNALGLRGLLPPRVHTQDSQVARVLRQFRSSHDDLVSSSHND